MLRGSADLAGLCPRTNRRGKLLCTLRALGTPGRSGNPRRRLRSLLVEQFTHLAIQMSGHLIEASISLL
jgi:hypothetical protein